MNYLNELRWRGMIHNATPNIEEQLNKEITSVYLGIDPTADSLHIGHLVGVMMLRHLQRCGHKPIVVIGGATGMIGDPSGKSQERNLLDEPTLRHNQECIRQQIAKFLDFDSGAPNAAEMLNNYDWMKDYGFLEFTRDIGKHITVNYMMSKESVRRRLNGETGDGLSFTEFTYQLLQGYDFLYLYKNKNCRIQLGGSDQWGNITTGIELIRRACGGEAFALTCPLLVKADGGKFGKTEGGGNIWLDRNRTSPYKFYQFWLNVSDEEALRYIKIFTGLTQNEIETLAAEQIAAPHLRPLQKALAEHITIMVHSKTEYEKALEASALLFGSAASDTLQNIDGATFLDVFEGVPTYEISADKLPLKMADLLAVESGVFASKGEFRKLVQGGGLSINKTKLSDTESVAAAEMFINRRYMLVQKGKKNYYLVKLRN